MGIIRRQGIKSFVVAYLGVLLGYFNKAYLFILILTEEQYGYVEFMQAAMVLVSSLILFSFTSIIIKYHHYFRDQPATVGQFNFITLAIPTLTSLVLGVLFFVFKDWIVGYYSLKSPLFGDDYPWLLILIPSFFLFELLNGLATANLRNVVPSFLREVVLRVLQTGAILMVHFGWIGWDVFLPLFVGSYWVALMCLIVYLYYHGVLRLQWGWKLMGARRFRVAIHYGWYIFFAGIGTAILSRIDIALIGSILGFKEAGIYSLAVYIASLIYIPGRILYQITLPFFSEAWKNRDFEKIKNLYQRTSINNAFVASILFLLIYANLDTMLGWVKPEFRACLWPAIILCLGKLIDVSFGSTGSILLGSKYYRYYSVLLFGASCLTIALDFPMLHWLGMMGPAIVASAFALILNLAYCWVIWNKMKMQPFGWNTVRLFVVVGAVFGLLLVLPELDRPIWNLVLRSGVVVVGVFAGALAVNASEDLNALVRMGLKRVGLR